MPHLIHVGNSLGIRIPKAIIAQIGFKEDTVLVFKVTDEGLLIAPSGSCRQGWTEAFEAPQKGSSEDLLMGEKIINQFDQDEWEW